MEEQLPILQIVVPLVAAPICILLRRSGPALAFATAVCWSTLAMAVLLLIQVLDQGTISYKIGNWMPPWGIEYRVDLLAAFVLVLVSGIAAVVLTYAPHSLRDEVPEEKRYLFCTAYLLCMAGLMGITITGDLFNVFVFLEISSLSSYAMISLGRSRRALTAAFQYLILGTIGATFILIGIGLLYMMTGSLNMMDIAQRIPWDTGGRTVFVAAGFVSVGVCIKMALFPLHLWLPNAYAYAPSVVTAFLAATATKVSVYVLLRFVFTVFSLGQAFEDTKFHAVLMVLALLAMFVCSAVAIFQTDIKRMLAYSSLAQIGYMVLGISFASVSGLTGGIVHLFNHGLIKGGMFLAMGCIVLRIGSVHIDDLRGIGKRMPVTMFLWVLGGLGLIGVPATAGFVSKWYLVTAALESGFYPVAVMILLSSLLAVIYIWRIVEVAYFQAPPEDAKPIRDAPLGMLVPTCLLIGLSIYFGLETSASAGVANDAARVLLGVAP